MKISHIFKAIGISSLIVSLCLPISAFAAETSDEYPLVGSYRSKKIINGSDGALWFLEYDNYNYDSPHIVRMTTSGTRNGQYEISAFSEGMTNGPDGAIWFTEYSTSRLIAKIGRLAMNGDLIEYDLPDNNSLPLGITPGPDGALWFTEGYGNKIGKITTNGTIIEYPIPTANAFPTEIVSGPDGALWFTELEGRKIGRITTSGTITEYPIPAQNTHPRSLTLGSDGALWFIEYNNDIDKLARIATSGIITEYSDLIERAKPEDMKTGPDGALWLILRDARLDGQESIARITTNGAITARYNTASYQPVAQSLTVHPNGSLWYGGSYAVGRLTMPVQSQATNLSLTPATSLPGSGGSATLTARATNANGSPAVYASITFAGGSTAGAFYHCVTDSTGTCSYTFSNRTTGFVTSATAYVDNNLDGQRQQIEPQRTATQIWLP